ncbi:MAG: alpha/beta hydrolase [Flavobacteriaceae bacterium]
MKKYPLLFLLALLFTPLFGQQHSLVYDDLSMDSEILGETRKYAVYLPPGYHESQRSYPVLYLLHGLGDDQTGWIQFGEVQRIVDTSLQNTDVTEMIIIMPDADTTVKGYFNSPDDQWRYEDFFFEELIPHVEKKYRIKSQKRFRAIAGLSMGGGGSLMYAMHHPELFSAACPLSAYVGPLSFENFQNRFKESLKNVDLNTQHTYYSNHNALELTKNLSSETLKSVRWYIDCGDDDFLYEGNSLLHIAFTKKQIPHQYRVRDGAHTWTYWRSSLPEVLLFVSQSFHQY